MGGRGEGREAYGVASDPSGVGGDRGGREAYGVAEKPRGDCQGVGGGVELLQGIDTPGVDVFYWGDKTPGVDTEGNRETGEDGQGRGGDGNSPTTRASADSVADGGNNGMAFGPRTVPPPRLSCTAADDVSAGPLTRKSDGVNGSRTENGMHPRREYGLLALEEPEGGQANAGTRARGDGHGATSGTVEEGRTDKPAEAETGQRTLLACVTQEDGDKAQIPPDQSRALNVCVHPGGGGGGGTYTWCSIQEDNGDGAQSPPDRSRVLNASGHPGGERGGGTLTWQRIPTSLSQGTDPPPPPRHSSARP